jgi:hypothetical protein
MATPSVDRGLGTTFERFAIYQWLEDVVSRYPIQTALEGPGDGVAGIPGIYSIPLAQNGCKVTIALENKKSLAQARPAWNAQGCRADFICVQGTLLPFPDHSFDLVWNFNRLPFLDARALVTEMTRLSRRYVALVVPNRRNYGFPARWLYHKRTGRPWIYGNTKVMHPSTVQELLTEVGLQSLETHWLDVPWWPDIIDPIAWLRAMIPGAGRVLSSDQQNGGGYQWKPNNLPYFDPATYPDVHRRMHRLGWMERRLPQLLQTPFAHHVAVLAVREGIDA